MNLWYHRFRKDLKPAISDAMQAMFDSGHEIGEWAKLYFSGGVENKEPYYKVQEGAQATLAFIAAGHECIFEATAIHPTDGSHCRIDVLRKVPGTDAWDMIEVKGSTGVKDYHVDDMSFQYRVFTGAGFKINKCYMMLIDNKYVRNAEIDPQQLLKLEEITGLATGKQIEVEGTLSQIEPILQSTAEPKERIGARCFKPFECEYMQHCWKGVPDYSIYNIFNKEKAEELVESLGSYEIKSLPADKMPGGHKAKDIASYISGEVYIESENIKRFLGSIIYPLYFLDYETLGPAVPLFDGTRPFQAIPFQFSLHCQRTADSPLEHFEFLHQQPSDPRPTFIEELLRLIGKSGTVVTYNQAFEKRINDELAQHFPSRAAELAALNARMLDLLAPFQKRWLYHPSQQGSASIKAVLPAFTELSYQTLHIGDGEAASRLYLDFMRGKLAGEAQEKLWQDLKTYCGLDTLAMHKLLAVLRTHVAAAA